jgi:hypothetical protein
MQYDTFQQIANQVRIAQIAIDAIYSTLSKAVEEGEIEIPADPTPEELKALADGVK